MRCTSILIEKNLCWIWKFSTLWSKMRLLKSPFFFKWKEKKREQDEIASLIKNWDNFRFSDGLQWKGCLILEYLFTSPLHYFYHSTYPFTLPFQSFVKWIGFYNLYCLSKNSRNNEFSHKLWKRKNKQNLSSSIFDTFINEN